MIGITSETDATGRTIFYEYDSFGRLNIIRDNEGNIVKKTCYNYMGQQADCNQ
uniref:RHS repeat domain-containing protein n=1 Tax=Niabella hibiscisoli TaxID=1825928 RepID=UPI00374DE697